MDASDVASANPPWASGVQRMKIVLNRMFVMSARIAILTGVLVSWSA
jgi:hypothetical protein